MTINKGLAIFALTTTATFNAAAADSGLYLHAGAGKSIVVDFDNDCRAANNAADATFGDIPHTTTCDDRDAAFSFSLGYQVSDDFAVELGHTNLGEFSTHTAARDSFLDNYFSSDIDVTVKAKAITLSAVGLIPVSDQAKFFGRLGVARTKLETLGEGRSEIVVSNEIIESTEFATASSNTSSGLYGGIGFQFNPSRDFGLTVEYQHYYDIEREEGGHEDIGFLSAGILARF